MEIKGVLHFTRKIEHAGKWGRQHATWPIRFGLVVDFDKKADRPERIFDGIASMIRSLQNIDQTLISCVDGAIKPVLMLENVEAGSIKVWLAQAIAFSHSRFCLMQC